VNFRLRARRLATRQAAVKRCQDPTPPISKRAIGKMPFFVWFRTIRMHVWTPRMLRIAGRIGGAIGAVGAIPLSINHAHR
jgi:hypothetical protein